MGAIYGAKTDDIELYHKVFDLPAINDIEGQSIESTRRKSSAFE
jgi:hypothetical protein